jgi:hypothetical protein
MTSSANFASVCPCGAERVFIGGREQPHECRPISAQQVRDAWAEGYKFARSEVSDARLPRAQRTVHDLAAEQTELLDLLRRLVPADGLLYTDEHGKEHCAFCREQRGRHFLAHSPMCPWDEARKRLGLDVPQAVRDEPPYLS